MKVFGRVSLSAAGSRMILVGLALVISGCPGIEVVQKVDPDVTPDAGTDTGADGNTTKTCEFGQDDECDDGDSCTNDECSPQGQCVNTSRTSVCKIGNECYAFDEVDPGNQCRYCDAATKTAWTEVVCEDDNACTDNLCSAGTGCNFPANDSLTCDDGDPCSTDDACSGGVCVGTCACAQDSDCSDTAVGECEKAVCTDNVCEVVADEDLNGTACAPEDPCLEGATCTSGICSGGAPKDCTTAGDDCNAGVCNATSGECVQQPFVDGTPCDQANECTTGACTGGTCDTTANVLQDCTPADSCIQGAKCTATAECKGTWDSSLTGCNCVETAQCDDGITCTTEICAAGECNYELQFDKCLIGGQCFGEGEVNPDNPCQSCNTAVSSSSWTVVSCADDGDPCTLESCNSANGLCETDVAAGANCDDGDPCTVNDLCNASGTCAGTTDDCDDGNPCTADVCDAGTGSCVNTITDGVACDAACVVGGVCNAAGACVGTLLDCDDGNPCTIDTCDTSGGSCANTPDVGAACQADSDPCTSDRCTASGICQAQTLIPNCVLYETEFDCGAGDWTFEVLSGAVSWALDNTVNPPGFWSGNCSLNFNNDYAVLPNYFSPFAASAGTATSGVIDASDADSLFVSMYQYWDTQEFPSPGGGGYEQRELRVSTDGFQTFTSYDFQALGHVNPDNQAKWFLKSVDISEFAGQDNVQLMFWFDTLDAVGNEGAGWYIDDLTVSPAPASVPSENCGNGADDDLDGLTDCDDPSCDAVCAKPGDTCGTAFALGAAPSTTTGNLVGMSNKRTSTYQCAGTFISASGNDSVYAFVPAASGNHRFTLAGTGFSVRLAVVSDCEDAATCLAGGDGFFSGSTTVTASLEGGTTYYVIVDGGNNAAGPYQLKVTLAGESDCTDGTDNDGDGAADCLDFECQNDPTCRPESACGDGEDNDGDGAADCADDDCSCSETTCDDGIDDDLDGQTDCDDNDCNSFCLEGANCSDGVDNDGDGFTDCGDVGDCGTNFACQEQSFCSDDVDNDLDGLTDCDDSDCDPAQCDEADFCSDGLDNDDDSLVDCADADCASSSDCLETDNNCNDYIDNDGDGATDCDDSQCVGNFACTENCSDGVDNDKDGSTDCSDSECSCTENSTYDACHDSVDNDQDGSTDCNDSDCNNFCSESFGSQCGNGKDDDGNGAIDCADSACATSSSCDESLNCFDGKDNDGNGAIDCADTVACGSQSSCQEGINCNDGTDNDGDGQFDCDDSDCSGSTDCVSDCTNDNDCDDADGCTFDACIFGQCTFAPMGPGCCSADSQCDDANVCTTDTCSTASGGICEFASIGGGGGAPNVVDYDFETPVTLTISNSAGTCGWQQANVGLAQSGDQVLYYGDPGVGNFECGDTINGNSGTVTTESFTVPANATLGFWLRMDTEPGSFDYLELYLVEGGGVQTLLWEKAGTPTFQWVFVTVDMTPYDGLTGQLRFSFDTGDGIGNTDLGVMIDDLVVGDPCN